MQEEGKNTVQAMCPASSESIRALNKSNAELYRQIITLESTIRYIEEYNKVQDTLLTRQNDTIVTIEEKMSSSIETLKMDMIRLNHELETITKQLEKTSSELSDRLSDLDKDLREAESKHMIDLRVVNKENEVNSLKENAKVVGKFTILAALGQGLLKLIETLLPVIEQLTEHFLNK